MSKLRVKFTPAQRERIIESDAIPTSSDVYSLRVNDNILLVTDTALVHVTVKDDRLQSARESYAMTEDSEVTYIPSDYVTAETLPALKRLSNSLRYCKPHATVRTYDDNATSVRDSYEHRARCADCRAKSAAKSAERAAERRAAAADAALDALL